MFDMRTCFNKLKKKTKSGLKLLFDSINFKGI